VRRLRCRHYSCPLSPREVYSLVRAGLAAGLALSLTACSMTMPIGTLKEKDDDTITTGSITPARPAAQLSTLLSDEDWRRAQAALGVAVDPQGNGAPVSWDNPETGRKGSFVAAGPLYVLENKICRSFIATIDTKANPGVDHKLQGSSCRNGPNDWAVKEAKPWKG
jgi:surface antigen